MRILLATLLLLLAPAALVHAADTSDITFNVLDRVEYSAATGKLRLIGHFDASYPTAGIPYFEYLKTLLDHRAPEFSLNWTPDSAGRIASLRRRLDSDEAWRRMARDWARWVDDNGYVTPAGRYFMPQLGIKPPGGASSFPERLDQYQLAAALLSATGNEAGSQVIGAFSALHRAMPNPTFADLRLLLRKTDTLKVFNAVNEQVIAGSITKEQGLVEIYRALMEGLDRPFFSDDPSSRAFDRALARTGSSDSALDAGLQEFDHHILVVYKQALTKIYETAPELNVPASLIDPGMQVLNVEPVFKDVDRTSLLAKLMFETDYISKRLLNAPELVGRVGGYQTEQMFRRNNGRAGQSRTSNSRLWISVAGVEASRSSDGNVLFLGNVKMAINIRALDDNDRDLPGRVPGAYEALLTRLYDDFAKQYSPVFHEFREAAKLAYAAQWLKARNLNVRLPSGGDISSGIPDVVPGIVFITWSPNPSYPDVQTISVIGGGTLYVNVPPPGPPVCVSCGKEEAMLPTAKAADVEAYLKTTSVKLGPIGTRQLPSVTCLAAAAAGLPGLGLDTSPPAGQDQNTLAVMVLNSAFDGTQKFSADCEVKIAKASAAAQGKADAARPAVDKAVQAKANQLDQAARAARKEYDEALNAYQQAGGCVKNAAARQRQLHEPSQYMRQTTAEFIDAVQDVGRTLTKCGNQVVQLAPQVFEAKRKLQRNCEQRGMLVKLNGKPISFEQQKVCTITE